MADMTQRGERQEQNRRLWKDKLEEERRRRRQEQQIGTNEDTFER